MKILLTGITGTWGNAFTKLLKDDHELIGVDHNEKSVAEFKHNFPDVKIYLKDFSKWQFEKEPVDLLIHLAAYKHLSLAEKNVFSCVENNITKTLILFENAKKNNVKILFVSTDKAVEPIGVYGATKFIGERLAWEAGGVVSRSGNVLASNGSVLEVWEKEIKNQKPLTITNPEIQRYFITADRVVREVWNGYKAHKKLIIPNMGKPVKIKDLLKKILKDHGYNSIKEYKPGIKIIGMGRAEKIAEKLHWDYEKEE